VDLEDELISSLSEINREMNKNKFLKEELIKIKEDSQDSNKNYEESQHVIMNLKAQLEESSRIEKIYKS